MMGARITAPVCIILFASSLFASDAVRQMEGLKEFRNEWERYRTEATQQLAEKRAQLDKARSATDLDAKLREMETRSKEIAKAAPKGIQQSLSSTFAGKPPLKA